LRLSGEAGHGSVLATPRACAGSGGMSVRETGTVAGVVFWAALFLLRAALEVIDACLDLLAEVLRC
jgi:hypothetical protein